MKRMLRRLIITVALGISGRGVEAQVIMRTQPMALDSAMARRAGEAIQVALTGDTAAIAAYLRENGAPELLEGDALTRQVADVLHVVGSAGVFVLDRLIQVDKGDIAATLRNTTGGEPAGLVVRMEPNAPNRIKAIRPARLQVRMGPPPGTPPGSGAATTPDPRVTMPNPRSTTPDVRATVPDPRSTTPDPRATVPDPRAIVPDPRAIVPDPRAVVPTPRAAARSAPRAAGRAVPCMAAGSAPGVARGADGRSVAAGRVEVSR